MKLAAFEPWKFGKVWQIIMDKLPFSCWLWLLGRSFDVNVVLRRLLQAKYKALTFNYHYQPDLKVKLQSNPNIAFKVKNGVYVISYPRMSVQLFRDLPW